MNLSYRTTGPVAREPDALVVAWHGSNRGVQAVGVAPAHMTGSYAGTQRYDPWAGFICEGDGRCDDSFLDVQGWS